MKKFTLLFLSVFIIALTVMAQETKQPEPAFTELSEFPNVRDLTLSATGDEAYFSLQSPLGEVSVIACIKKKNNQWTAPELLSFSGKYSDLEPFLSPDGLKLYFASNRPLDDSTPQVKDYDIWYVKRMHPQDNWSEPINLGAPVNTEHNEFYPALSANQNLYFTSDMQKGSKGKDDIYVSLWKEKTYTTPYSLSGSINTAGYEFNAYIAPDESFIIYSGYNRPDGFGSGDLYISYRDAHGNWSASKNLGENINSNKMDYCPYIDLHSKTLYFTSRRSAVTMKDFNSLEAFVKEIKQYTNGLSRLYKVSVDTLIPTSSVLQQAKARVSDR